MAHPPKARLTTPCKQRPDPASSDFGEWVQQPVDVDVTALRLDNIEVSQARRFRNKIRPSEALAEMPDTAMMCPEYDPAFKVYMKKYEKLLDGLKLQYKTTKPLKDLCAALNIDGGGKVDSRTLAKLLARLCALDMVQRPS